MYLSLYLYIYICLYIGLTHPRWHRSIDLQVNLLAKVNCIFLLTHTEAELFMSLLVSLYLYLDMHL